MAGFSNPSLEPLKLPKCDRNYQNERGVFPDLTKAGLFFNITDCQLQHHAINHLAFYAIHKANGSPCISTTEVLSVLARTL